MEGLSEFSFHIKYWLLLKLSILECLMFCLSVITNNEGRERVFFQWLGGWWVFFVFFFLSCVPKNNI